MKSLLLSACFSVYLFSACTGSSPTWTTTTDRTSVVSCISGATAGDTINVAAGSATWSSAVVVNKRVTLAGAGAGSTIITGLIELEADLCRVTGFTFNVGSGYLQQYGIDQRFDHNTVTRSGFHDFSMLLIGNKDIAVQGLIDHNTWVNGSIVMFGEDSSGANRAGNTRYFEPLDLGTAKAIYIEDNTFISEFVSGSFPNVMDGNRGSRMVFRFNTVTNGRLEQHSLQGNNQRAVRMWEIYNNALTSADWTNYRPYLILGGTGMIFHNTSDGNYTINEVQIANDRSFETSIEGQVAIFQMCGSVNTPPWTGVPNGNSFVDGNTTGQYGYPCRDQIGRSTDAFLWANTYPNPAPSQAFNPAYIWRNTQPSGEIPITLNCDNSGIPCSIQSTHHIVENRDYYGYAASFDGTSGVGEGVLASRPSTCTTGVGYWATDQGSWNSSGSGGQGQLYTCASTNTWTLYYTPYTYPHPLQGGGGSSTPVQFSGKVTLSGKVQ